jgi:spore coat protein CotH
MDMKKGWTIKMDHFVKGQEIAGDVDKLNLKPGADSDDVLLKNMLYTNFQRALGVPVERGSYALLYINDIFTGLYFMHEQVDKIFISSRYKIDNGDGNLFKMNRDVYLRYLGDNVTLIKILMVIILVIIFSIHMNSVHQ